MMNPNQAEKLKGLTYSRFLVGGKGVLLSRLQRKLSSFSFKAVSAQSPTTPQCGVNEKRTRDNNVTAL